MLHRLDNLNQIIVLTKFGFDVLPPEVTPNVYNVCDTVRYARTNEVLEPVTFVLVYHTVSRTMYKLGVTSGGKTSKPNFVTTIYLIQFVKMF